MTFTSLLIICTAPLLRDTVPPIKTWDIVINELMVDPDPAAGTVVYPEYIELYNKRSFPAPLKNWKLCIGATCKSLPDVVIPADSFLVITSLSASAAFPAEVNVAGIAGFPALTNTGQQIQLLNEVEKSISFVTYTDDWYQDAFKKNGGYSLEQVDPGNPCAGKDNWRASVDKNGGTPGKKNSIAAAHLDIIQPSIHHISVQSPTQLELYFTEAMDSVTLFDPHSYHIATIGNPVSIRSIKPRYDVVQLVLGKSLQEETVYTISIDERPCDCAGNKLEENSNVLLAIPVEAKPTDIVVNEVLFDPNPNGVDFLEIYNRSFKTIDLRTVFTCHYDPTNSTVSSVERITMEGYLFFPGTYLTLTENATVVKQQYHTQNPKAFLEVANLPALNADKGDIAIKTATDLIDFFMYDAEMHVGLLRETKGVSLERISPEQATNNSTNWHSAASSVGFATPGFRNSQFVEESETTETFTVFPETFTPDNNGMDDVVNLSYQLDEPGWSASIFIYDIKGRLVKTIANNELIGTSGSYTWDGTNEEKRKETTAVYLIYVQFFNPARKTKVFKKVCVLSGKN
jgi:hypothetical protein